MARVIAGRSLGRRYGRYALMLALLVSLPACSSVARVSGQGGIHTSNSSIGKFYAADLPLSAIPGTLIRSEPLSYGISASAAKVPFGNGYRILYVSQNSNGVAMLCGGMLFVPNLPTSAPRPVVAWAHPVIGPNNGAPSRSATPLASMEPWLSEMMRRGWVVVATDYSGVGSNDQQWLNGAAEARDVVNSVLAARAFRNSKAGSSWAAWGYSYGGHAALWSGELAGSLAGNTGELHLVGVATVAPVAELVPLENAYGGSLAASLLAETPPPLPPNVPVFIAQGTADHTVIPSTTALLEDQWCRAGSTITVLWMPKVTHRGAVAAASQTAVNWLADRFKGQLARRTCNTSPPVKPARAP